MMEDKLRLNAKLYGGFEGIIGRRDYFLNKVYIWAITIIFTLPYTLCFYSDTKNIDYIFAPGKGFYNTPDFIKIWLIVGLIGISILTISNIFRRLNDIAASCQIGLGIFFSIFKVMGIFWFLAPNAIFLLGVGLISIILESILLFKKGKITSNYPYDFTKEFNWGAFLGTWIWGLINKTYIMLLWFIVSLTPWSFYFALYCGLKGNEWAYKNKKYTDVEEFNKSQEKQATIFALILGVVIPILYFICVLGFILLTFFILSQPPKTGEHSADTKSQTLERRMENILENSANLYFKSYKIEAFENIFYIEEDEWKKLDYTKRKDILDLAASVSVNYKEKMSKNENGHKEYYYKSKELNKTRIYGANSNKLLAEFNFDLRPDMNFKDIMKESIKAYRFYEP